LNQGLGFAAAGDRDGEGDREIAGDNGLRQFEEFDLEVCQCRGDCRDDAAPVCDQDGEEMSRKGFDFFTLTHRVL
jgi:hypothetical protein